MQFQEQVVLGKVMAAHMVRDRGSDNKFQAASNAALIMQWPYFSPSLLWPHTCNNIYDHEVIECEDWYDRSSGWLS